MLGFQLQHHAPIAEFYMVDLQKHGDPNKHQCIYTHENQHDWLENPPCSIGNIEIHRLIHGGWHFSQSWSTSPLKFTPLNIHGERNLKNHPSCEKEKSSEPKLHFRRIHLDFPGYNIDTPRMMSFGKCISGFKNGIYIEFGGG